MAKFKTRARAVDMLGRQQIAGIPTAISELFKNAHDAYADRAEVDYYRNDRLFVLRDDGVGMTREDFEQRWLTLGTESKVAAQTALGPPPTDPKKPPRAVLGEKGIGRLAIAAIGPQVLILSRAERDGQSFRSRCRLHPLGPLRAPRRGPRRNRGASWTVPLGRVLTKEELGKMLDLAAANIAQLDKHLSFKKHQDIRRDLDSCGPWTQRKWKHTYRVSISGTIEVPTL